MISKSTVWVLGALAVMTTLCGLRSSMAQASPSHSAYVATLKLCADARDGRVSELIDVLPPDWQGERVRKTFHERSQARQNGAFSVLAVEATPGGGLTARTIWSNLPGPAHMQVIHDQFDWRLVDGRAQLIAWRSGE